MKGIFLNFKTAFCNQNAFSIVELLVAMAVFVFFSASTAVLVFSSEDLSRINEISHKALFYAEEGLEATRAIRDGSWGALVQGDHGLAQSGSSWIFSGTSDVLEEKYRRQITLIKINDDKYKALSQVRWFNNSGLEKSVNLTTYLTNWQRVRQPSGGSVNLGDSARDLYLKNNYVYLAVDNQHKSMVVVNAQNPLSPQVVATKDLNGDGRDVFVNGNYAYLALSTNKIIILDITNPASPQQVASMNLSSHPTSVFVLNGYAYIGQDKANEGLVIYNVANPRTPYFYRSYNVVSAVYDVKVKNGWIYMAVNAGRGFDMNQAGNYAFVAVDAESGGFEVYYISGPTVTRQAILNIGAPGSNAFFDNGIVYVAVRKQDAGLARINVNVPTNPTLIGSNNINGEGNGVFYQNPYAYMAVENEGAGLAIVNVGQ